VVLSHTSVYGSRTHAFTCVPPVWGLIYCKPSVDIDFVWSSCIICGVGLPPCCWGVRPTYPRQVSILFFYRLLALSVQQINWY